MTSGPQSISEQINQLTKDVSVRKGVHFAVENTNNILFKLERSSDIASSFVSSRIRPLWAQVQRYTQASMAFYQRREYYGPQIVAGSAAAVGMLVSLRRGKIPGVITGSVAGIGSYGTIYGFPKP